MRNENVKYIDENILFVGPVFDLGGIGSVFKVYREKYIRSNFISTYPMNEEISKIKIFIIAIAKIKKIIKHDKEIKILHIHCASGGSFYRKSIILGLGKIYGRKVIMHMHGGGFKEFYNSNRILKPFIKYILSLSDKVICLSEEWEKFYKNEMKIKNTVIIENSIEVKTKSKKPRIEENIKLLFMGKICEEKGIFELIEYLKKSNFFNIGKIMLYICGNGDSKRLEEMISTPELSKYIRYLGWVEGLKKEIILNESDIYILPSHFEGVPISILEALAYGKPIIATRVGGIPSLVKNGINGWLMEKAIFTPLEDIFEEIFKNPKVLEEYGDNAYKTASSYKPSIMFKKLDKVYQECLIDKNIYDKENK